MSETNDNPYQSPSAPLVENDGSGSKKLSQFIRFTAWGVFGLGIITFGIYTIYWLYSRATTSNAVHENQIGQGWILGLAISYPVYLLSSAFAENSFMAIVLLVATVGYLVTYIAMAFKIRNRLQEMMNEGSDQIWKLNGVLTFFFSTIYLQYKINEYLDTQKASA